MKTANVASLFSSTLARNAELLDANVEVTDGCNLALTDEELERRIRDEDLAIG